MNSSHPPLVARSVSPGRTALRTLLLALAVALALPATSVANDWIYTTRPGDNIWNLTERHLKSIGYWNALVRYNNIERPRQILPGTRLRIPIRWLKVQPASATLAIVRGDVVRVVAASSARESASVGDSLQSGDGVTTGADSSATIRFADGSLMLVHADSEIVLDAMSAYGTTGMVDTRLRLNRGRLENDVEPARGSASRYQIITPSAVVAVRGTDFRAAYGDGVATSEVTEGSVRVSAERRGRNVPEGFGLRAEAGKPPPPPVELLPSPDLSSVPERIERVLVELEWDAVDGAQAYRAQIFAPGTPPRLLVDRRLDRNRFEFDAPVDGDYLLRLRAIDGDGLEGLDAEQRMVVNARPIPPRVLGPARDAAVVATPPPELWWSKPVDIERFHVQLARDEGFTDLVLDQRVDAITRLMPPEPLEPGMHYWRIASIAADGEQGPFGDASPFRAQVVPDAATASSDIDDSGLTISWDRVANAQRYEFQLSRDAEFTDLVVDESLDGLSYGVTDPEAGEYWFRARGISDEGVQGPYSPTNSLEVPGEPLSPGWLLLLAPLLLL